jgi:hypothetical protein
MRVRRQGWIKPAQEQEAKQVDENADNPRDKPGDE